MVNIIWFVILASCAYTQTLFRNRVQLDPEQRFLLAWDVDYSTERVFFKLEVKLSSHQWFGFGFSDYGELTNADLITMWTDPNRMRFFQDAHTDDGAVLHIDDHQDFQLIDAWSRDGLDTVVFYRKFDTCHGDYVLDRGTTHLIYILGDGNPRTVATVNATSLISGLQRVQLLKPDVTVPALPADAWTFDILAPSVEIPNTDTTYWWYVTKLPPLYEKHHIIKYEGRIDQTEFVHHMEVFHCVVPDTETIPRFSGPGLKEGKPPALKSCRNVIGAWAMGAGPVTYPEEAGSAIGGPGFSRFVLLEVHYNNPSFKSGYVDASGIRFTVTRSIRRYDAGIMELGLEYTNKMAIPPGQKRFALSGYCTEECTRASIPPEGIYIFASQFHTHLTGRRTYTKHVRRGKELPEINRDNHYSPHFQEIRLLPKPVHVQTGDAIIHVCEYRTVDRQHVTIGGYAISDEMCVNYVHYYPKVDLEVCKSSIQTKTINDYFKFMHHNNKPRVSRNRWDEEDTSASKGDRANYNSIRWSPLNTYLLKELYKHSPLSMQCNRSTGERFPGNWEGTPLSTIRDTLSPTRNPCD